MFSLHLSTLLLIVLYDRHASSDQELPEAQHCKNTFKTRLLNDATEKTYPTFKDKGLYLESSKHDKSKLQYLTSKKSIQSEHAQLPLVFEGNISGNFIVNESLGSSKLNKSSFSERNRYTNVYESSYLTFQEKSREDSFRRTSPENNPYSVLLVIHIHRLPEVTCTGSLITDQWILTAAHCITKDYYRRVSYIGIYAGGNSAKEYFSNNLPSTSQNLTSNKFYTHPKYSWNVSKYDVAVVKANGRIRMTKYVKTIRMAAVPWKFKGYASCTFTGFGVIQTNEQNIYDKVRKTYNFEVRSPCRCALNLMTTMRRSDVGFLCSKPRGDYGVCAGDSGGGLICDGLLWGVAIQIVRLTHIPSCAISNDDNVKCGSKKTISVFESTCPYLRWINHHVTLFNKSQISKRCKEPKEMSAGTKPTLRCVIALILINMMLLNM